MSGNSKITKVIGVRMTDSQIKELNLKAKQNGQTRSDYMRDLLIIRIKK
jgi:hypothetical protein